MAGTDHPPVRGEATTPAQFGSYVERIRRTRGLTQGQLAEAAGVPRRFVNELEGGHATLFARRLFDVLGALDARLAISSGDEPATGTTAGTPAATGVTSTEHPDPAPIQAPDLKDLGW